MNVMSIIIVAMVAALALAAAFSIHRARRRGEDCSGCALKSFCRR